MIFLCSYAIDYPIYEGATYDASTTNLTYTLPIAHRELEIVLSFLSPITPTSTLRQSIPASYVNVYVNGNVDVNVYIDLNGQWVSGDRAEWGTLHFVAPKVTSFHPTVCICGSY